VEDWRRGMLVDAGADAAAESDACVRGDAGCG